MDKQAEYIEELIHRIAGAIPGGAGPHAVLCAMCYLLCSTMFSLHLSEEQAHALVARLWADVAKSRAADGPN